MRPIEIHVGSGAVYSFDPVGSYERETCRAAGAASSLVQPFLDNQVCIRPVALSFRWFLAIFSDFVFCSLQWFGSGWLDIRIRNLEDLHNTRGRNMWSLDDRKHHGKTQKLPSFYS